MLGPKPSRSRKDYAADIRQDLQENEERNAIEWKIGNGKRKHGQLRIMANFRLQQGSRS